MDVLAPLVRCAIAPSWAAWEGSPYLRHYRQLLYSQFAAPQEIERWQWRRISELLKHACRTTRYWRSTLKRSQLSPEKIRSFADFRHVPILTKMVLRECRKDLLSDRYREPSLHRKRTSGSTGVPVEVLVDQAAGDWKRACVLRSDEWSGWRLGQSAAVLWGRDEFVRKDICGRIRNAFLERRVYLDTLQINESRMAEFVAALRRRKPSLLFGHAHSLYLLARYLRSSGGTPFRPRAIISTAMALHTWERRVIEEVLHCPVTNRYGCEEVSIIACECDRHAGMHVISENVYLEILRTDGTPADPGEAGRVVVTDLANWAMPIIRYEVGDVALFNDPQCGCARGLPVLQRVEGRVADYVVTPGGELVSGISLTDHFNTLIPGILQLQIIQEEVDRFVFRIVKAPDFGAASLERLRKLVDERFGPGVRFECEFTGAILPESSGKYRFCVSKVNGALVGVSGFARV